MTVTFDDAAKAIVAVGRFLDGRGWAPATAGNYSARIEGGIAITASGLDKGALTAADILVVGLDGRPIDDWRRPSAETLLHVQIYRDLDWVDAVLHTHSVTATVLGMMDRSATEVVLANYELLKAFPGFETHEGTARIPVFENTQDMPRLAAQVSVRLREEPNTLGYLIRGHGLYTWGHDITSARRHVEALEFLLACELERERVGR